MSENTPRPYTLYYSETSGKYFIRYNDQAEKEITRIEYLQLLEEKDRMFQHKVNEKTTFEQAPQRKCAFNNMLGLVVYFHPEKDGCFQFENLDAVYGEAEIHPETLNIYKISNHGTDKDLKAITIAYLLAFIDEIKLKGILVENMSPTNINRIREVLADRATCVNVSRNSVLIWRKGKQLA